MRTIDSGKRRNIKWIIIFLYALSVAIRYWFSRYPKIALILPDEVRYLSIAQSLLHGKGIEIYNLPNNFQKILYSVLIMPAFLISDKILRLRIIALINCVAVCAGIFPTYLLSRKYLKSQNWILFVCFLYCISSDLTYSMTFMSENLFLPMGLMAVYLTSCLMDGFEELMNTAADHSRRIRFSRHCFETGIFYYALYSCKEVAAVFPIALAVLVAVSVAKHWRRDGSSSSYARQALLYFSALAAGFFIPFLIMKVTLFAGMGNSYHQQDMSVLGNSFNYFYLYYGFIYYLLMVLLAYGILPIMISVLQRGAMKKNDRHFLYYLLLLLILSAAVVSFTITARENQGDTIPRIHLRYTCYLFIPMVIMMLNAMENSTSYKKKQLILGTAAICTWLVYYALLGGNTVVSSSQRLVMDHTMLLFLSNNSSRQLIILAVYSAVLVLCAYLLCVRRRAGILLCECVLLGMNAWNTVLAAKMWRYNGNRITVQMLEEEKWLSEFVAENADKNILVISKRDEARVFFVTYADEPNIFTVRSSDIQGYLKEHTDGDIAWSDIQSSLKTPYFQAVYSDLTRVDYIVLYDDLDVDFDSTCGTLIQSSLSGAKIYEVKDTGHVPEMTFNTEEVSSTDQLDQAIDDALKNGLKKKAEQASPSAEIESQK